MKTSFMDAILRRADKRPATDKELREREERRRNVAQLVSEIAVQDDASTRKASRQTQFS